MKTVMLVLFSLVTSGANEQVYNVSCGVNQQSTSGDYKVSASLKSSIVHDDTPNRILRNYILEYTVFWEDEIYASETITGGDILNDSDYNPSQYKNHVRFTLPSTEGKVELIYPKWLGDETKFKAHLILTNIAGHFGGTVHLYCQRRKVE